MRSLRIISRAASVAPPLLSRALRSFGSAFADHVANPGDILLFWRRPKPRAQVTAAIRKSAAAASSSSSAAADGSLGPVAPQELASITLEDLVLETLQVRRACETAR